MKYIIIYLMAGTIHLIILKKTQRFMLYFLLFIMNIRLSIYEQLKERLVEEKIYHYGDIIDYPVRKKKRVHFTVEYPSGNSNTKRKNLRKLGFFQSCRKSFSASRWKQLSDFKSINNEWKCPSVVLYTRCQPDTDSRTSADRRLLLFYRRNRNPGVL